MYILISVMEAARGERGKGEARISANGKRKQIDSKKIL